MKILMLGNSYTYFFDMPQILQALLDENCVDAKVDSVTAGGRVLWQNLDENDALHAEVVEKCKDIRVSRYIAVACFIIVNKSALFFISSKNNMRPQTSTNDFNHCPNASSIISTKTFRTPHNILYSIIKNVIGLRCKYCVHMSY